MWGTWSSPLISLKQFRHMQFNKKEFKISRGLPAIHHPSCNLICHISKLIIAVLHNSFRQALRCIVVQYQTDFVYTVQYFIDFVEYCQKIKAVRIQSVPNTNTLNMTKQRQWSYIFWWTWLRYRVYRCTLARWQQKEPLITYTSTILNYNCFKYMVQSRNRFTFKDKPEHKKF
jgi:hypothetical protein